MNAIFYVLRGGCPWRTLQEHFPPHQTAYRWFTRFRDDGTWERLPRWCPSISISALRYRQE